MKILKRIIDYFTASGTDENIEFGGEVTVTKKGPDGEVEHEQTHSIK